MPSNIRRLIAKQLCQYLPRSATDVPDAVSRLAWCIRLSPHTDTDTTHQASIPYAHLRVSKLVPEVPWPQQIQWAKDFQSQVKYGSPIEQLVAEDQALKLRLDLAAVKQEVISYILCRKHWYGMRSGIHDYMVRNNSFIRSPRNENVVIEYSSPNIAKPFHAGHLRSTVLGNFLANLNAGLGHNVTRINWLGDWGTQFGLLGVAYLRYGKEKELQKDAMKHLLELYVRINQEAELKDNETGLTMRDLGKDFFCKMENGDYGVLTLWQYFRDRSIASYSQVYERLGVRFDYYHGEAMYHKRSMDVIKLFEKQGLLSYDNGKAYVDLSDEKHKHLHATLVKSDGTTLYLSRDIAAAIDRHEKFKFDRAHYVVDQSQYAHFQCMLGCLQKLQYPWANKPLSEWHVDFGRIEGMSTRRGDVVFLQDILDEAKSRMLQLMKEKQTTKVQENLEEVADTLGMSAIFIQDMKQPRRRNYKFSWHRMLQFTGETGIRMQYTHARLCSLERESGVEVDPGCSLESLQEPAAYSLILHLARFDEAINEAFCDMEPYHLTKYLFTLVSLSNIAHKELQVKGQPLDVAQARLVLFCCSRIVLANGMRLLGLRPLEKM